MLHPTKETDEAKYRHAQQAYDAALHGSVNTLSNVNFYRRWRRRGGPTSIFYRPGGRDADIRCIRCPLYGRKSLSQIGELDFVTLPSGGKIAVEMRSVSGEILMSRKASLQAIRSVRDIYGDTLKSSTSRNRRNISLLALEFFFALVLTGIYALYRLSNRASTRSNT